MGLTRWPGCVLGADTSVRPYDALRWSEHMGLHVRIGGQRGGHRGPSLQGLGLGRGLQAWLVLWAVV